MQMIDDTGAGYLVFTTGWGGLWFPGPIDAINRHMAGRRCERDLVMELADGLAKRNRKLILYWGWWVPDTDYAAAWGNDLAEFTRNFNGFLSEVGERYGTKLAGFFFDGEYETRLYPNPYPYEFVTRVARTGNPSRVVSYNNWVFPRLTDFQDDWIGESTHALLPPPGAAAFAPGGPQEGMQAHLNTFLDDFDCAIPRQTLICFLPGIPPKNWWGTLDSASGRRPCQPSTFPSTRMATCRPPRLTRCARYARQFEGKLKSTEPLKIQRSQPLSLCSICLRGTAYK